MADLSDNLLHEVEEDERTPRPRKTVSNEQRISRTLPPLNFPMPDPSAGRRQISPQTARRSNSTTSDSNLLSSTELSTEHSHSRSSQRSRSQRLKHLADFQLADGQVEIIRLGHSGTPFPKPMQELVQSLAKIQGRTAVVPKAVKSKVAARMEKFWPLIYDPWLPPQVNNITMESKMVDYALVIEPGVEMGLRIKKKRLAETKPSKLPASINHTAAEFMRFNPIGINRTHSLK
ncbi:MAG: hypothetical protein LQ342_008029 [Letrouitia transgressa]|nr:MAG: hypothetical protein LQ342_008029 [Letrouitia transgressa]